MCSLLLIINYQRSTQVTGTPSTSNKSHCITVVPATTTQWYVSHTAGLSWNCRKAMTGSGGAEPTAESIGRAPCREYRCMPFSQFYCNFARKRSKYATNVRRSAIVTMPRGFISRGSVNTPVSSSRAMFVISQNVTFHLALSVSFAAARRG